MLDRLRGTVSDRTLFLYQKSWDKYWDFCAAQDFPMLDAGSVLEWRTSLVEAAYSPNTINSHLSAIKSIFAASVPTGDIDLDTYTRVRAISTVSARALRDRLRPPKDVLSDTLVEDMIRAVSDPSAIGQRDRAILCVFATSGLRIDELVNLKWDDVNVITRRFWVLGKTDIVAREVPMSELARSAIMEWRFVVPVNIPWLFPSFTGRNLGFNDKAISKQAVYEMVVLTASKLGITISPHDFRRYVATKLSNQNIVSAQAVLGHRSISTTQRYVQRAELPSVDWLNVP